MAAAHLDIIAAHRGETGCWSGVLNVAIVLLDKDWVDVLSDKIPARLHRVPKQAAWAADA